MRDRTYEGVGAPAPFPAVSNWNWQGFSHLRADGPNFSWYQQIWPRTRDYSVLLILSFRSAAYAARVGCRCEDSMRSSMAFNDHWMVSPDSIELQVGCWPPSPSFHAFSRMDKACSVYVVEGRSARVCCSGVGSGAYSFVHASSFICSFDWFGKTTLLRRRSSMKASRTDWFFPRVAFVSSKVRAACAWIGSSTPHTHSRISFK